MSKLTDNEAIEIVCALAEEHIDESYEGDEWEEPQIIDWEEEKRGAIEIIRGMTK